MKSDLNTDTIFNFFVTAYHVMDYVKAQGKASETAIAEFYDGQDFQICRDICNKGKHLELRKGDPFTTHFRPGAVLGQMILGESMLGEAPSYSLYADGQQVDVVSLGQRVLEKWGRFFKDNGI